MSRFYTDFRRGEKAINEVGFIIRFVEFMNRIIQQRWYRDAYLQNSDQNPSEVPSYKRIRLPGALEPPTVPSVLPFHTVGLLSYLGQLLTHCRLVHLCVRNPRFASRCISERFTNFLQCLNVPMASGCRI